MLQKISNNLFERRNYFDNPTQLISNVLFLSSNSDKFLYFNEIVLFM